jgi:hypothetical protein
MKYLPFLLLLLFTLSCSQEDLSTPHDHDRNYTPEQMKIVEDWLAKNYTREVKHANEKSCWDRNINQASGDFDSQFLSLLWCGPLPSSSGTPTYVSIKADKYNGSKTIDRVVLRGTFSFHKSGDVWYNMPGWPITDYGNCNSWSHSGYYHPGFTAIWGLGTSTFTFTDLNVTHQQVDFMAAYNGITSEGMCSAIPIDGAGDDYVTGRINPAKVFFSPNPTVDEQIADAFYNTLIQGATIVYFTDGTYDVLSFGEPYTNLPCAWSIRTIQEEDD